MQKFFLTALLLAICFSLCALAKDSAFNIDESFAKDEDGALDDSREARVESDSNGNFDFYEDKTKDDDMFFAQEDDDELETKKSVDYSEWEKMNGFKLNDDKKEVEEEKGMLKKFIQKFKNMLHKLGKRR